MDAKIAQQMENLFAVIKANCNEFGGDKETYSLAFKARAAVKYGNKEFAKRHGFAFAKHAQEIKDSTGTLLAFAAIVEHAHNNIAA